MPHYTLSRVNWFVGYAITSWISTTLMRILLIPVDNKMDLFPLPLV